MEMALYITRPSSHPRKQRRGLGCVPFIAANPSVTVLQRDRQIGLSARTFGCHER